MKPFVRRFDVIASRAIAVLPESLHKPFDLLGYVTSPPVWAGILVVYVAAAIPSGINRWSAVGVLLVLPAAGVIKFLFRRERPPTIYAGRMKIKSYSFPSSHAYCAALAGGYFSWLALSAGHMVTGYGIAILAAVIGVSRVHIGAHYPSDVIAGWVGGLIILITILCIT